MAGLWLVWMIYFHACISCKNIQRALKSDYDVTLPSCVTNLYTKVGEHYKYSVILMPYTIINYMYKCISTKTA